MLPDLYALLFLALGPLLLFLRILFAGKTLYYRDITLDFQPQTAFIVRALHAGQFPIWNPLSANGYPQLAGMQPPFFYPPSILFYYLDYPRALTLYLLFHFLLAGWGAYALARWWSWSRPAAALTGLLFSLGGSFISLVEFYTSVPPAALLPLVVLGFDRAAQHGSRRALAVAAVLFGLQVSNGRPDISVITTLFLLGYAGLQLADPAAAGRRGAVVRALLTMTTGGVLLNSLMLVPTVELLQHSTRLQGIPLLESGAHSLSPFHLITLVVPGFFGDPEWGGDWGRLLLGEPYQHYSQLYLSLYPGLCALVLALFALRSRQPLLRLLAGLAGLALLLSFGNRLPLFGYLQLLPLFRWLRHAVKYFFLVDWCLVLAAGLGCEVLLNRPRQLVGTVRPLLAGFLAAGLLLGLAAWQAGPLIGWAAGVDYAGWVAPDPTGLATPAAINAYMAEAVPAFFWPTWRQCLHAWLLLGGLLFLISLWAAQVLARRTFVALLLLLALGDLLGAHGHLLYTTDGAFFRVQSPVVNLLPGDRSDYRIFAAPAPAGLAAANQQHLLEHDPAHSLQEKLHRQSREILDSNVALDFGLATASLYASLVPFQGPHYLWRALEHGNYRQRGRTVPDVRRAELEGGMGIRFLLSERRTGSPPQPPVGYDFAAAVPLATNPGVQVTVFRNRFFVPRAHFATSARLVHSLGSAAYLMVRKQWDFRHWTLLVDDAAMRETLQLRERLPHSQAGVPSSCRIVADEPNRVAVHNESPNSGFLVLTDIYYPGWRVTVDGQERPLLNADTIFRAVYLEAGRHEVEFRYDPLSFKVGALLSLLAALLLLLLALRRPPHRGSQALATSH